MKAGLSLLYIAGVFAVGSLATPVPADNEVASVQNGLQIDTRAPAAVGGVRSVSVKRDSEKRDEPVLATTLVASFEEIYTIFTDAFADIQTTIAQLQSSTLTVAQATTAVNDALNAAAVSIQVSAEAITSTITTLPPVGTPGFTTDDAHRIAHIVYRTLRSIVAVVVQINSNIADNTVTAGTHTALSAAMSALVASLNGFVPPSIFITFLGWISGSDIASALAIAPGSVAITA